MAERIRFNPDVALAAFSSVIPMPTLAAINAAIDRSFGEQPERAEPFAMAELLRRNEAFRKLEETVCAETRAMATTLLKKSLRWEAFHVIRCASTSTRNESHCRHYDSHLLTLLIPLKLAPDGVCNGDLLVYHPPRLAVSTVANVFCKLRHGIQRNLPFHIRKWLTLRDLRRGRCNRVPVEPGSVYVFNGFVLQHANLDVEVGERRSLLIHYYDPGYSAGLSGTVRGVRMLWDRLRKNMTGMYPGT